MQPKTHKINPKELRDWCVCTVNIGSKNLINPKPPSFSISAASIIEVGVDASTWAYGNHIWKGKRGIFTAKATKSRIHKIGLSNCCGTSIAKSIADKL